MVTNLLENSAVPIRVHHPEVGRAADELPAKRVHITKAFYMGSYEITQAQYEAVMHQNPSVIKGEMLPVYQVRYRDALEFCRRLSRLLGVEVTLPTIARDPVRSTGERRRYDLYGRLILQVERANAFASSLRVSGMQVGYTHSERTVVFARSHKVSIRAGHEKPL